MKKLFCKLLQIQNQTISSQTAVSITNYLFNKDATEIDKHSICIELLRIFGGLPTFVIDLMVRLFDDEQSWNLLLNGLIKSPVIPLKRKIEIQPK